MELKQVSDELKTIAKLVLNHRGRRRLLVRDYFFRVAKRFSPVLAMDNGGLRFFVSTADDVVGRVTFTYENFDLVAMTRLMDVLRQRTGRPEPMNGRVMVDIGGNIGTTTVYALRKFGAREVITFEPAPDNLVLLRLNLLGNDVSESVRLFEMALSNADGSLDLELSSENSGDHRVRTKDVNGYGPGAFNEQDREVVSVRAARLDSLIEQGQLKLDDVGLVWIDVQGHEGQVLAGASKMLEIGIPVAVEYWPYGLDRSGGLRLFDELVAGNFTEVVDMGPPFLGHEPRSIPPPRIKSLRERYPGVMGSTDLLLLP